MFLQLMVLTTRFARLWAWVLMMMAPGLAWAGPPKMALVVGNAAYAHVPGLETATDDAQDVASALRDLGFEVTLLTDVGSEVFWVVLDTFAAQSAGAETVLFYYAGHAFQSGGVNHLVPVGARLDTAESIGAETWTLDTVAGKLRGGSAQVLIFLDACRTSPLPEAFRADQGVGLAQYDGGAGTFVAFATRPGAVAFDRTDGGSRNSPFTAALLNMIGKPGQSISDLMIGVRNAVDQATGGQQVPWDQSSLRAQVFLVPEAEEVPLPELELVQDLTVVGPPVDETAVVAAAVGVIRRVEGGDVMRLAAVSSDTRGLAAAVSPVAPDVRINGLDSGATKVVAVPVAPHGDVTATPPVPPTEKELHAAIQTELKRIGCYSSGIDGDWGKGSQAGLERFYAAQKIKAAELEGGAFAPTEAAWRSLLTAPEKTCEPIKVVQPTKKKPSSSGTTTKKKAAATTKKAAPAPAPAPAPEKKGVKCKFMVVAVVCS